ncbi:hypothetical protein PMAYCL1PPCAC_27790, partial [Pristionchus mayeri]
AVFVLINTVILGVTIFLHFKARQEVKEAETRPSVGYVSAGPAPFYSPPPAYSSPQPPAYPPPPAYS